MISKAKTVADYVKELPEDRREAIEAVRAVILKNLGTGFEEGIEYGMISYYVPHSAFPAGYHCDPTKPVMFAALASQKNHMAVYLTCAYGSLDHAKWFREAWAKTGKKLDMGKSCVRFKKLENVALDVIGQSIARVSMTKFLDGYTSALKSQADAKAAKKPAAKKAKK